MAALSDQRASVYSPRDRVPRLMIVAKNGVQSGTGNPEVESNGTISADIQRLAVDFMNCKDELRHLSASLVVSSISDGSLGLL